MGSFAWAFTASERKLRELFPPPGWTEARFETRTVLNPMNGSKMQRASWFSTLDPVERERAELTWTDEDRSASDRIEELEHHLCYSGLDHALSAAIDFANRKGSALPALMSATFPVAAMPVDEHGYVARFPEEFSAEGLEALAATQSGEQGKLWKALAELRVRNPADPLYIYVEH